MTPRHHLDEATLVSHAAGALSAAMAAVAATHLDVCRHCRERWEDAERIGGVLLSQQQVDTLSSDRHAALRSMMLEQLDAPPVPSIAVSAEGEDDDADHLPRTLRPWFGNSWRALRWRWMAPGIRIIRAAGTGPATLMLMKIAPSKGMPLHSHGGNELTQILQGGYDDAIGHFGQGDMADLDSSVVHQPITSHGLPCICVAALDAPLRFPGWLARKLQPLVGL